MKTEMTQSLPFAPPPAPAGTPYVLFQFGAVILAARSLVDRLRADGIDAYWESYTTQGAADYGTGASLERLCNVYVAQPHLVCAMVRWRLGFRGVDVWQKMSRDRRLRLAVKALIDGMLLQGSDWNESVFHPDALNWLKSQLRINDRGLRQLLVQARNGFDGIGRRDLHLGTWLSLGLLVAGVSWWQIGPFSWPIPILLILGMIFGVHTLVVTLPRVRRTRTPGLGASHPSIEATQLQANMQRVDVSKQRPSGVAPPLADRAHMDLFACLQKAKGLLNQGDAKRALDVLESFAANDLHGAHTAYPEFYEILRVTQQSLGLDARQANNQINEMQLDWISALKKGQQMLKEGKAEESIAYFRRSLAANPGEAGTASGEDDARQGIRSAEALLKRRQGVGDRNKPA